MTKYVKMMIEMNKTIDSYGEKVVDIDLEISRLNGVKEATLRATETLHYIIEESKKTATIT